MTLDLMPPVSLADRDAVIDYLITAYTEDPRYGYDSDGGQCLYRTPDGAACAIGKLIPNDLFNLPNMSGINSESCATALGEICDVMAHKPNEQAKQAWCLDLTTVDWLENLQRIHDTHATWGDPFEAFFETLQSWRKNGYPSLVGAGSDYIRTHAWEKKGDESWS